MKSMFFSRVLRDGCDDREVPRGRGDERLVAALLRGGHPQGEDALHAKVLGADGAGDAKVKIKNCL